MIGILCPYCRSSTEMRTNGYYCHNCKRTHDFYSTPAYKQIEYDKKVWSEKEIKNLIRQTIKEFLGEEE